MGESASESANKSAYENEHLSSCESSCKSAKYFAKENIYMQVWDCLWNVHTWKKCSSKFFESVAKVMGKSAPFMELTSK